MMIALCGEGRWLARASRRRRSARPRPPMARPPILRKLRRVTPSQNRCFGPNMFNMLRSPTGRESLPAEKICDARVESKRERASRSRRSRIPLARLPLASNQPIDDSVLELAPFFDRLHQMALVLHAGVAHDAAGRGIHAEVVGLD